MLITGHLLTVVVNQACGKIANKKIGLVGKVYKKSGLWENCKIKIGLVGKVQIIKIWAWGKIAN